MRNSEEIAQKSGDFLQASPLNRVPEMGLERIFDQLLVGLAAADDPLYSELKKPEVVVFLSSLTYNIIKQV